MASCAQFWKDGTHNAGSPMVEKTVINFGIIKRTIPNSVVVINPLSHYYENPPAGLAGYISSIRSAGLDVVDATSHMPKPHRDAWYNLPYDGHWTDEGSKVYGRVVADIIGPYVGNSKTSPMSRHLLFPSVFREKTLRSAL